MVLRPWKEQTDALKRGYSTQTLLQQWVL